MKKEEFPSFLENVNCCYDKRCSNKLPAVNNFPHYIFDAEGDLDSMLLHDFANAQSDKYLLSVAKRLIALDNIKKSRDVSEELDIVHNWRLILDSILLIPSIDTVSSIGSQGFLSIPLYRYSENIKEFEFIRLHIWDSTLNEFIDREARENFSIHSHTFHTHSWTILGQIVNERYLVRKSDAITENSLFSIEYNKTINEVNQHTSCAENTINYVDVKKISHEIYMPGGTYQIKAGDYHKSSTLHEGELAATLFSFSAKYGFVDKSYVVGPSKALESEINRKMHIDPKDLLMRIDSAMHKI